MRVKEGERQRDTHRKKVKIRLEEPEIQSEISEKRRERKHARE